MIADHEFIALADSLRTPVFIFDENELLSRIQQINNILNDDLTKKRTNICYSVKANPFLIPSMLEDGSVDRFEVCSPGELSICMEYKVPPKRIIYSGVHKESEDISEALTYGVEVLTAESIRHYDLICEASKRLQKKADILLRLSSKSQFGMSLEDVEHILEKNKINRQTEIIGIHYFAGTQRTNLKHQRAELSELKEMISMLREKYGIPLKRLEYGPGFSYPYFEKDDFTDTLSPVKELSEDLDEAAAWCDLTVEMGRFIASSSGYYLTRAVDIKRSYGRNWCILDGGINHVNYLGQMMGMMVPIIKLIPGKASDEHEEAIEEWALCGSLCTTNDVLVRSYKMKEPALGDLFVFCNIGAYSVTEAINLFLSRDMPKIGVYKNGEAILLRDTVKTWRLNC